MIKDEHEYQVTKSWISKFQQAIITLGKNEEKKSKDPEGWQLQIDSYFAHIKHLLNELVEYESLINHSPETSLFLQNNNVNLDEIGDTLIKVRIAKKISQKELARLANLTEDEVVDYEKKEYQNASFGTMIEVAEALGIKFQQYTVVSQINESLGKELLQLRESEKCGEKIKAVQ